jgi:lambda family phage minor tail protein L|tara:strand:+ start:5904 stop:7472 length:1569 start_codon:yes stop_codon:yes gene_type:complete
MSDLLLNVDLQEQSPSAEETASGNAIVTLFEVYLENSDLGGTAIDKLYFHDGTKSPADSYGNLQMYSPSSESDWGSTDASDYTLKTYTPFPFEFNGYERRAKGAIPRPTIRFSNINRDFTVYNTSHEDLLGAKVVRRRTLAKYLEENPPVEFPKEIYYIERLVSETSMVVEYELTTNFDLRGVQLPARRIIASRCNWKYKDATRGGCDWPSDSTKDFTNAVGGTVSDQKVYVDVDDTYITAGNVDSGSNTTTYDIFAIGRAYTKNHFTEYYIPLSANYAITAAVKVDSTHTKYTIAGTSLGFSVNDYINVRGVTPSAFDFGEIHLKVSAVAESGGNTLITVISTDVGSGTWSSGGQISKTRNTLFRCKKALTTDTNTASTRPGSTLGKEHWEVGDVCGKRLTSCRKRYGFIPNAGSIEAVTIKHISTNAKSGIGYTSAPTITIADPASGTTATATCTISSGSINAIELVNAGSGYTSPPAITLSTSGSSTAAQLIATVRGGSGEPADVPLPFGGFPGAVTYS